MLTVHHLQASQSERIPWLCEELGIDYDIKLHRRSPLFSPPEMYELHPLGAAPIIQDGPVTLAESNACVEYIVQKHGKGRLFLPPSHKDYATFLYWYHFANGSLQPGMSRVMTMKAAKVDEDTDSFKFANRRLQSYLRHLDEHLATNTWMVGDEFTAADIMPMFTLTTFRAFVPIDLGEYKHILAFIRRCVERPGYQRYRQMADPDCPDCTQAAPPPAFLTWKKKPSSM
ncbi:hypothetical protein ANO11243_090780 [Dothideomycetidae sp. 11243]|nr:hypothetical protein ANO11243_090780 [fungal sp. No.11243]